VSNSLLNISMITKEALRELKSQLAFASGVNRQYDDQFAEKGAKIGSVLNIRKPVRYSVTTGAALNVQDVADQYTTLSIDTQQHVGMQFSSKDLTLSIDEFRERYVKPAITALAHQIDYTGLQQYLNVYQSVGTPGTQPTSVVAGLSAGQKLDEAGAPVDDQRTLVLPPSMQAAVVGGSLTLFHDQGQVAKQYRKGRMGEAAGFTWQMDQNCPTHSTGAVDGTPLVKTTISTQGATAIAVDGITTASITGAYKAGDVITIGSIYSLNPQTKQSTGQLMQFVVTATANAASNEIASLAISPAIYTTGNYANCSALPADGDAIKLFGHATTYTNKVSPTGLAFHKDAFVLGMADLALPGGVDMAARASDPDAGLSIRIVRQYDINNDVFPCRLDVLYGWKTVYPELACRIQG
jgi:hypothetical protein